MTTAPPARRRTLRVAVALVAVGFLVAALTWARSAALLMTDTVVNASGITCGSVWHSWNDLLPPSPKPVVDPVQFEAQRAECAEAATPRAQAGLHDLAVAGVLFVVPAVWLVALVRRHRAALRGLLLPR